MGNTICVQGFINQGYGNCVVQCPTGYDNQTNSNTAKCVYRANNTFSVNLNPLAAHIQPKEGVAISSLEDLQKVNPNLYTSYLTEKERVEREIATLNNQLGHDRQVQDAFKLLQDAENIRDKSPNAYQQARYNYYKLLKGDSWEDEEKERLEKAEVEPEINKIRSHITNLLQQITKQQETIESMKTVKDKVLSVKDEFQYSVNTLNKQLETVQAQLILEKRKVEEKQENDWSSLINFGLNVLILIILASIGFMVYKILIKKRFERAYTPPTQIEIIRQ